jgi:acetyl-CoA synthetase
MQQIIKTHDLWREKALVSKSQYQDLYAHSLANPDSFWAEQAERLTWSKKWSTVQKVSFNKPVSIEWYLGGQLNVAINCIDRHLATKKHQIAYVWVPEDQTQKPLNITYQMLSDKVAQLANGYRELGIKKGDRVTIYLPMIPEAVYAMLACARIGAVHSVIFAGFSPHSIADRIIDGESHWIITADEGIRGGKKVPLKKNVDEALKNAEASRLVKKVVVVRHTSSPIEMMASRDVWYHELAGRQKTECPAEVMNAEDPLFILYTSGSTGKPKGVLHTTAGYLTYAAFTHEIVFDYHQNDVYWCAADIGWVTGHSYIVYGPLANGATSILYEGLPTYPTASRIWEIIDEHKVNILYTAPTLIRALMKEGEAPVQKTSRKSLKVLGSVGEPINPEAWMWYYSVVGNERCPIVDTWWQTETGGILISPLPGATDLKPGSASFPLFGIEPVILSDKGEILKKGQTGHLCMNRSWPGQMRTVYRDHKRFEDTYFSQFPGRYYAGDECRWDEDGYYWINGRADDVINVSGHRLGTAEIESALITHKSVAESAVVGYPHDIKGTGIYAFVTLRNGIAPTEALKKELIQSVRSEIGPIASPDIIQWAPGLPKTRSGKIMRRILKKIAANDFKDLGDTTTLADPTVVENLISERTQSN